MIAINCPRCKVRLIFEDQVGGTVIPCPDCAAELTVPGPARIAVEPAQAPSVLAVAAIFDAVLTKQSVGRSADGIVVLRRTSMLRFIAGAAIIACLTAFFMSKELLARDAPSEAGAVVSIVAGLLVLALIFPHTPAIGYFYYITRFIPGLLLGGLLCFAMTTAEPFVGFWPLAVAGLVFATTLFYWELETEIRVGPEGLERRFLWPRARSTLLAWSQVETVIADFAVTNYSLSGGSWMGSDERRRLVLQGRGQRIVLDICKYGDLANVDQKIIEYCRTPAIGWMLDQLREKGIVRLGKVQLYPDRIYAYWWRERYQRVGWEEMPFNKVRDVRLEYGNLVLESERDKRIIPLANLPNGLYVPQLFAHFQLIARFQARLAEKGTT